MPGAPPGALEIVQLSNRFDAFFPLLAPSPWHPYKSPGHEMKADLANLMKKLADALRRLPGLRTYHTPAAGVSPPSPTPILAGSQEFPETGTLSSPVSRNSCARTLSLPVFPCLRPCLSLSLPVSRPCLSLSLPVSGRRLGPKPYVRLRTAGNSWRRGSLAFPVFPCLPRPGRRWTRCWTKAASIVLDSISSSFYIIRYNL